MLCSMEADEFEMCNPPSLIGELFKALIFEMFTNVEEIEVFECSEHIAANNTRIDMISASIVLPFR